MQGRIDHELGLWRRHLYDKEVRAVVVVVRRADLDVVVAIALGGDQVEPSDRAQDVALRDAKGLSNFGMRASWKRASFFVTPGASGSLSASMRSPRSARLG